MISNRSAERFTRTSAGWMPMFGFLVIGIVCQVAFGEPTSSANSATSSPSAVATLMTTKDGVRFGVWPGLPDRPAPTLFVFATTVEGTLNDAVYRQAANLLGPRGYLCVAVDLPCHGPQHRDGEPDGLSGWRYRIDRQEDVMLDLTTRARAVLDHLVDAGWADAGRVAACGTSRGGFSALHFAAAEPRVKCVAAYAPVTDLPVLSEFQRDGEQPELVTRLSIERQADRLAGRAVWLIIGDRDERVGTDHLIGAARAITRASLAASRPALVEFHVLPEPKGHTTPAGASELSAVWIESHIGRTGADDR